MKPSEFVTVKAPAKLNLFLEIGDRLEDGYHEIESVMQSVTLYDTLTFSKTPCGIELCCSDENLSSESNLVVRASKLFFEKSGINGGIKIRLEKNIPVSAGLGGGSTDAAATLSALNGLYGEPFTKKQLSDLGKSLGADIPFCLKRGLCLAAGIGERLSELGSLPECFFVISKGERTVLTGAAYARIDECSERERRKADLMIDAIKNKDLHGICRSLYNGFEQNGDHDDRIKEIMLSHGAEGTLMTGSGPSVFGVFVNKKNALSACGALAAEGFAGVICRPE